MIAFAIFFKWAGLVLGVVALVLLALLCIAWWLDRHPTSLQPDTEIQLPDGRWVLAITYPQYDASVHYPTRRRRRRSGDTAYFTHHRIKP